MRNIFHHSIVTLLVIALVMLGLQSVSFAAAAPVGQDPAVVGNTMAGVEMVEHGCGDCETNMDCCASADCQTAPHCVSWNAIGGSIGILVVGYNNAVILNSPDVSLASLLVPTIYRPPWA